MERDWTVADERFMRRALELARTGEGRVSPNPPVGCVLVKGGAVTGEGWHDRLGDLHAEAMALRNAGVAAAGATAYVTLSPCHTAGRQPPCTEALLRAGVAEVVVAAEDPNPKNDHGLERLRQAGLPVRSGLLRAEAEYLMRGFFKVMRHGLPHLTAKYAMTLDGKIATASGDSRWVSGPDSREWVQDARSRADAVMVGSGTALRDDPLLNVRDPVWSRRGGAARHRQPLRVIVDSRCRLSPDASVLRDRSGGRVLIAAVEGADSSRVRALTDAGAEVASFPEKNGRVQLEALLRELARRGVNQVLAEAGGGLTAGLFREGLVDEVAAFVAPKILGGRDAQGPVADLGLTEMGHALPLELMEFARMGDDILIRAKAR